MALRQDYSCVSWVSSSGLVTPYYSVHGREAEAWLTENLNLNPYKGAVCLLLTPGTAIFIRPTIQFYISLHKFGLGNGQCSRSHFGPRDLPSKHQSVFPHIGAGSDLVFHFPGGCLGILVPTLFISSLSVPCRIFKWL